MSSLKQIEANRGNALKSTGPTTQEGKERSRCNAVRHGLTAETVIADLEDAADYQAFEAAVIADYDAQTAVERELVLRLASVLWRLRRATGIESGIFESLSSGAQVNSATDRLYVVTAIAPRTVRGQQGDSMAEPARTSGDGSGGRSGRTSPGCPLRYRMDGHSGW